MRRTVSGGLLAAALAWIGCLGGCHLTVVQVEDDADVVPADDGAAPEVVDDAGTPDLDVAEDVVPEDDGTADDAGDGGDGDAEPSRCGNGVVDRGEECDGDPPRPCLSPCDSTGTQRCGGDCRWDWDEGCVPPAEACNGRDDDCDTVVDDGFECPAGRSEPCVIDACAGTRTCAPGSCTWDDCDLGPAPPNDVCFAGIPDVGGTGLFSGSLCGASGGHDQECGGTLAGGPDLFFRLVLTAPAEVTIDASGGEVDAVLFLYAGVPCLPGAPLACDNDDDGVVRISQALLPGLYWVVLDTEPASRLGNWTLEVAVL